MPSPFRTSLPAVAALALLLPPTVHLSAGADQAADVVAHARAALGGDGALSKVQALRVTGAVRRVAGEREIDGTLEVDLQRPDKYLQVETMNPMGDLTMTTKTGFNGDRLITSSEQHGGAPGMVFRMGGRPEDAAGQARMVRGLHGDFNRDLVAWLIELPAGGDSRFTYVGRAESPDGSQADAIDATGPDGFTVRLYLDAKSGRPLMASWRGPSRQIRVMTQRGPRPEGGRTMPPPPPNGAPPEADIQLFFSDYHRVDGLQFPFHISRSENGNTIEEWTIKKVEVNPTFPADLFAAK
ncbi:MAG: hypothetical protein KGN76_02435 [Acidobacteriota bacterium]|nr:hypothetical protein [Acidobacteriota bacterium]